MKNKELNWYTSQQGPYTHKYWVQAETKRKAKTLFRKRYGFSLLVEEIKEEPTWTITKAK